MRKLATCAAIGIAANLLVLGTALAQTSAPATETPAATPSDPASTPAVDAKPIDQTGEPMTGSTATAAPAEQYPGMFGPLRIGITAALGFPHPLTYGLDVTYANTFGGALSFGSFETPEVGGAKIAISNWDLRGRWFPFGGSFFLGAAYGSQTLEAEATSNIKSSTGESVSTKIKLEVDTTYLTPHLGWFATWDSGFTMGFELGYQMAMSSKVKDLEVEAGTPAQTAAIVETEEFKKSSKDVKDAAEGFGKTNVPYLTLLRLGWML